MCPQDLVECLHFAVREHANSTFCFNNYSVLIIITNLTFHCQLTKTRNLQDCEENLEKSHFLVATGKAETSLTKTTTKTLGRQFLRVPPCQP